MAPSIALSMVEQFSLFVVVVVVELACSTIMEVEETHNEPK